MRLGVGDQLACFDGQGTEYVGTISRKTGRGLIIQIVRTSHKPQQTATLWLAQGLLKADHFDWVVQKATELGVARLSPILTHHTVIRLTTDQGRLKHTRWQRIAQEAAKQCRRTTLPLVDPPQPFERFLLSAPPTALLLMPTLTTTAIPLSEALKAHRAAHEVIILIGPEGDFSRGEVAFAEAHGARPVSLGPLTLRAETAAVATLAIVQYALGSS